MEIIVVVNGRHFQKVKDLKKKPKKLERKYDIESDFYADNFSEDNRNVVVEFFSHLGTGTTRQVYDTMEEALEYFADYAEIGDSITLIEK